MLIPGASEISRFEHTLGVLRLAQEWIRSHQIGASEADELKAAALLHDVQTGPFGHSLQYILEDNKGADQFSHENLAEGLENRYYQDVDANTSFAGRPFRAHGILGKSWRNVTELIRGKGKFGQLISGSMDLDNIDNVVRLALHCGVAERADARTAVELVCDMELREKCLVISVKSVPRVVRWQELRRRLYELLLLDWAEFSAKAMLTLAMESAIEKGLVGADTWLKTDNDLVDYLEKRTRGTGQHIGEIIKRLRCGELYAPVVLLRSEKVDLYNRLSQATFKRAFETELARRVKNEVKFSANFLLHLILDVGKTERAVEVTVRETDERLVVGRNSRSLLVGVFTSRRPPDGGVYSAIREEIIRALGDAGLLNLEPALDPMPSADALSECSIQLRLM